MAASPLPVRRPELLLGILLSACLVLLSLQVRSTGGRTVGEVWLLNAVSPFVWSATEARSFATAVGDALGTRGHLLRENAELRQRVAVLEGEALRLRDAERDKGRLLALFGTLPVPPAGTRAARLLALETTGPFRTALLDAGERDGIALGGVVVASRGLLGRVVAVGARTARVQLLSDRTAAAGAVLVRTGRSAVAHGDEAGGVSLRYVPLISDVVAGDEIVTSGTDGVFPGDLPIGRVAAVRRSGPLLFLELPVTLGADAAREPLVFVLPPVRATEPQPRTLSPGSVAPR